MIFLLKSHNKQSPAYEWLKQLPKICDLGVMTSKPVEG